jgi:hypothetical protein
MFFYTHGRLLINQSVSKSWCRAPCGAHDQIFITVWQLRSCFCGAPSLTIGRICILYMLLALARAVFLGSESLRTRDYTRILLSQIWDFTFRRLLRLAGSRWRYSTPPPHGYWLSRAVAYCRQPASTVTPGIEPPLGPMAIYLFNVKTFVLSFRCSSFDKREGLDFFYNWCSLTTPYSTRGHIKVGDIYIVHIIHRTWTGTKFYCIQGRLSMQDSAAAYASTYLNLRNGSSTLERSYSNITCWSSARTTHKTPLPTLSLLLRVDSLLRKRVYYVAPW